MESHGERYEWRLRQVMADRGLQRTTDLAPLLAARGVSLSGPAVYRLVAQTPRSATRSTAPSGT